MKSRLVLGALLNAGLLLALGFSSAGLRLGAGAALAAPAERLPPTLPCPEPPDEVLPCSQRTCVVDIRGSSDPAERRNARKVLKAAVNRPNTTVRLGPDVDLDFSDLPADWFPIRFSRCVTLTSVASFGPEIVATAATGAAGINLISEARTPRSRGPVLRFGKHSDSPPTFLEIRCLPDRVPNDGVRISGFRIYGPDFGHQTTEENGIRIRRCLDIEITNMEIAGWGGAAIRVDDDLGPNLPAPGRITNPDQIRIHRVFIHHNQHPTKDGHAVGYGLNIRPGAWAKIAESVFDFNRHAIAANGKAGGYAAERNVVLKGGGYHGGFWNTYTHQFDVHGTDSCGFGHLNCGQAGHRFWYEGNSFQYRNDHAIKIRGKPEFGITIANNIFPHPGLEDDWGDDAIALRTKQNVVLGSGNVIKFDSFGRYGVCDFDGDAIDDLFLPTGKTWWYSSRGESHWWYLGEKSEGLGQVRLGYFDDDLRCDVLAERNGQWMISSGGQSDWRPLGDFGVSLSDVQVGRFDPALRDERPGATRRTTHAFRRAPDGRWFVTPLSTVDWKRVQSSSLPMSRLRFGDFTGDGVTDVLAVVNGRWAISESASSPWRRLNPDLDDAVQDLFIANMDPDDNIDDVLRLERQSQQIVAAERTKLTWWRSRNGTDRWREYKSHDFEFPVSGATVSPRFGFAGRFGGAPGGGVVVIDQNRRGRFFSAAEEAAGAAPVWTSVFAY